MLKACIGLNCARQIDFIDRRNCQLQAVPDDVFRYEATLEELNLDTNSIQELPQKLFRMTNLRKLTLSENELIRIPPNIANLTRLVELDVSKNGIEDIPNNLQFCVCISVLDLSCNPLLRVPESVATLTSLTHLYMNDTGLPALPREIGNLQNLIVLEARENMLRRIPLSIGELCVLQRLDLCSNEIEELPPTIGRLSELRELWLDSNCLPYLPNEICYLRNLIVLDVTKNKLELFPNNFGQLTALCDLHASENCIEALPESFGDLASLSQLKLDINHLVILPSSMGDLQSLTEVFLFDNMLEGLPASLFNIRSLEMLNVDANHISDLPPTVGNCKSLHVLSMRENDLMHLPDEIGKLANLRVLDVCGNRLQYLPQSISNLKLDALWVTGNQLQPLVSLHLQPDPNRSDRRVLMCSYLPQTEHYDTQQRLHEYLLADSDAGSMEYQQNTGSSQYSTSNAPPSRNGQKTQKLSVAFEPSTSGLPPEESSGSKLVRFPTPFRKDLKNRRKKPKPPSAQPPNPVFKKGSMDDLTLHAVDNSQNSDLLPTVEVPENGPAVISASVESPSKEHEERYPSPLLKTTAMDNLAEGYLERDFKLEIDPSAAATGLMNTAEYSGDTLPPTSHVQTIEVTVILTKEDGMRSLGFSIAGGKGSTPAYEDVDESIFITKISTDGLAEKDGRLRLGDKLLEVNGHDMTACTHAEAVAVLKSTKETVEITVAREVLVLLTEDSIPVEEEENDQDGDRPIAPEPGSEHSVDSGNDRNEVDGAAAEQGRNEEVVEIAQNIVQVVLQQAQQQVEAQQNVDDSGHSSPDLSEELVILDRSIGYIGMSIVGGANHTSKVFGGGQPGLYISKISPSGAAAATQRLAIGDKILQVNGRSMESADHSEAVDWLVSQDGDITMLVRHEPPPEGLKEIIIHKAARDKLGISIKGGDKASIGNPFDPEDEGIFISKLTKGGAAELCGELKPGMRLLEVNGISLLGVNHQEAVRALRGAGDRLTLLVCDGFDAERAKNRSRALSVQFQSLGAGDKKKSGSLDLLTSQKQVKRTSSSASVNVAGKQSSPKELQHVLEELTRFREQAATIFRSTEDIDPSTYEEVPTAKPLELEQQAQEFVEATLSGASLTDEAQKVVEGEEKEEKEALRCPTVSVSTEDTDTMLHQLEQSVTEMDQVRQEADKIIDESSMDKLTLKRKESAGKQAKIQQEKAEEMQSILSEVFSEVSFDNNCDTTSKTSDSGHSSRVATPNRRETIDDTELLMLGEDRGVLHRPSSPIIRPHSAGGEVVLRKKKPALVCPEKLSFKERVSYYQAMLDTTSKEEDKKKLYRRSWAPGTTHPALTGVTNTSIAPFNIKTSHLKSTGRPSSVSSQSGSTTALPTDNESFSPEEQRLMNKLFGKRNRSSSASSRASSSPEVPPPSTQEHDKLNKDERPISPLATSNHQQPENDETAERTIEPTVSATSFTSDPPISTSPVSSTEEPPSPPLSPALSPKDKDTSHTHTLNPYAAKVLANMPEPVTAVEEEDSPASKEANRNKELRRNLREEVERQVAKALSDNPTSEHT